MCRLKWTGIMCLMITLTACSLNKQATKTTETIDSVSNSTSDSGSVVKRDSSGTKSERGEYERETIFAYDTSYQLRTVAGKTDTVLVYVPRIKVVRERGNYASKESAIKLSTDSAFKKAGTQTATSKETIDKKKKTTAGISLARWAVFAIAISVTALLLFILYKNNHDHVH